ncbi:MAG: type II secretion system minor pseudopilin GspJ [Sphingosinicella sp.]
MKRIRSSKSAGFTLVEMLIALVIFGLLTAAGVTLLNISARTQQTSERLFAELNDLRQLGALLGADLALAAPRLYRDREGRPQRAFAGTGGGAPMLMAFVRTGWDSGEGPRLQRVGYRLRERALERLSYSQVDGAEPIAAAPLLDRVRVVRLRFRDDEGEWRTRWDASDPTRLPVAVELVTLSDPFGTVRQVFTVGSGRR